MADEIAESVEVETETEIEDKPVDGILDAITDEADSTLAGLDKDEETPVDGATITDEDSDDADTGATANNALTLPDAHIRSLKAYGWTDDEIKQNLGVLGDKFLSTAARIHKNRNDEVTSWADAGRKARTEQSAPKPKIEEVSSDLKLIDGDRLKKQYGEHELIDSLVVPYNKLLAEFQKIAPVVQQSQKRAEQAELETLSRQIESFFGSKELEPYKESYGDGSNMTDAQITERNKVLETADALMVGAKVQGRQLSLNDAMRLSFDSVSSGLKTKAARTQISQSLKSREKGITLKPTGKSSTTQRGTAVRSRGQLEKKVEAGLAAAFSDD